MKIKSAEQLLMCGELSGHYELEADISLKGLRWAPLGSVEHPFTGSFSGCGHTISDIEIASDGLEAVGFFGVNAGSVSSLRLERIHINISCETDCSVGAAAGVNLGQLAGVEVIDGELAMRCSGGEVRVGAIIGVNGGMAQNCNASLLMNVHECGGRLTGGGLVGESTGGLLETMECSGRLKFFGDESRMSIGLLAGRASNTVIRACRFSCADNTVNGRVFGSMAATDAAEHEGCIWRDNSGGEHTISLGELSVRERAVERMRSMATVEWTPNRTLEYYCSCAGKVHYQCFERGKPQKGVPYTHKHNSLESFLACFNEDGTLCEWVKSDGYDGFDLYMGCDCSGAVYWAWNSVSDAVGFRWTQDMLPARGNGTAPVDGYDAPDSMDTREILEHNTRERIARAFTKMRKGDALLAYRKGLNHTRLVSRSPVIYRREDGEIDLLQSYAITIEQGDGLLRPQPEGGSKSWLVDHHYSFFELLRDAYIPITIPALQKETIPEQRLSFDKGDGGLFSGSVSSNYRIISTEMTVQSENGETLWRNRLFTALRAWADKGNDLDARESVKRVELCAHAPFFDDKAVKHGGRCVCSVTALLSTGKQLTAARFTIEL